LPDFYSYLTLRSLSRAPEFGARCLLELLEGHLLDNWQPIIKQVAF